MNTQQPATVTPSPRVGSDRVTPQDPRYGELLQRNFNRRFVGRPEYVRLVGSAEQVVRAVQDAWIKSCASWRVVAAVAWKGSSRIPRCR